jgi:hypothetical protein
MKEQSRNQFKSVYLKKKKKKKKKKQNTLPSATNLEFASSQ